MTTGEKRAEAQRLRGEGLTRDQIAERIGYRSGDSLSRLLQEAPARREQDRRDNARRAAAKRAWEREHDRGQCPCGAGMCVGARRRGYDLCRDCRAEVKAIGRAMREERIGELWAEGRTLRDIAQALDTTAASIGVAITRMRERGWNVPYRAGYPRSRA